MFHVPKHFISKRGTWISPLLPLFLTIQLPIALMHDNGNMIIHILINVPQETRRNDADPPKGNADQVNILITRCVRRLPCRNNHLASGFIIADGGDGP